MGCEPIALPTGEQRGFLEDGDEVMFRGYCEREGFVGIGLGECCGTIVPVRLTVTERPVALDRQSVHGNES